MGKGRRKEAAIFSSPKKFLFLSQAPLPFPPPSSSYVRSFLRLAGIFPPPRSDGVFLPPTHFGWGGREIIEHRRHLLQFFKQDGRKAKEKKKREEEVGGSPDQSQTRAREK